MSGYLPKVNMIKDLTHSPTAKYLSRFVTIPTFLQCLEDPSLKYALIPSLDFCLDKQDPPEGGFMSPTLIITTSNFSEHCGYVYFLLLYPLFYVLYVFTYLSWH